MTKYNTTRHTSVNINRQRNRGFIGNELLAKTSELVRMINNSEVQPEFWTNRDAERVFNTGNGKRAGVPLRNSQTQMQARNSKGLSPTSQGPSSKVDRARERRSLLVEQEMQRLRAQLPHESVEGGLRRERGTRWISR